MSQVLVSHLQACIIEAARALNPPRIIAAELGITNNTVKVVLCRARADGIEIPRFKSPGRPKTGRKKRPLVASQRYYPRQFDHAAAARLRADGLTIRAIAQRMGVKENAIYVALRKQRGEAK